MQPISSQMRYLDCMQSGPCRIAMGVLLSALMLRGTVCLGSAQQASDALALASSLVRSRQYDAALNETQKALRLYPGDVRLRTVEAVAYTMKGDDSSALMSLRLALKTAPRFPAALRIEAEILMRQKDPSVIPVLQQLLEREPQDNTAREMLAVAEARHNDCPAALTEFKQVEAAMQNHPESLQLAGACSFASGRYPEASTFFARLQLIRPENADNRYDLSLAQSLSGENEAAAKTLAPLLEQTVDPEILLLHAEISEALGDTPSAASALRQAILVDPMRSHTYVRFAELCMSHESYQAGVDMVTAGLSRMPKDPSLFLARGLLYGGMAEYDRAESDFRSAELYDSRHGTGAYAVGLIQAQRNEPEQALTTVRAAIKLHPEDAQLHYLLARLLIEGGATPKAPAFAEAVSSARTAVHLAPQLISAHDLLAKLYMETSQHDLAIEQCRAALALDASDQVAMYRLMRSLRETGDSKGAQALAKQIAELHQQSRQQ